jgi:hypothetical protein
MLRLNFLTLRGDAPTLMIASCVRFFADGSLRGPDNCVIAQCLKGEWKVGGRMHREFECEGPVRVRLSLGSSQPSQLLGPFLQLQTRGGILYGDNACLNITLPGRLPQTTDLPPTFSVTLERDRYENP